MSEKGLSRRDFLVSAGTFAASALAAGGVLGVAAPAMAAVPLPWGYITLDPTTCMNGAKSNYAVGGCMYATGKGITDALVAAGAAGWDTFNPDFFKFGGGGIKSWGTVCGSINAGAAIIQMVAGASATNLINELFGWYCNYPFPSNKMDATSSYPNQPTSICKSPLCHNSSGKWAYTYGYRINSAERKERCGKVAGDCAYKTVELLNAWKAGTFVPTLAAPDHQEDTNFERCFTCHVGPTSKYDNAQGKMNCLVSGCHPDKVNHHL